MGFKNYLEEATLFNHPDRGIEIRPDGGMGSWTIERLVKDTREQLLEVSKKIKHEDYAGAEYILFQNGALKAKLLALAEYDKFKIKQGKRPIAVNKEINLSENEMKYQALAMAKELHTALAELTFIEMLSVMDPNNPAKKEVQELETMINKLTTDVGEFIQKYIPDVADAETADINELPDEEDPKDKIKPKAIPKAKEKLKAKDDSEEDKEDKMKKVKDKKKELKESKMKSFKEFLQEIDMDAWRASGKKAPTGIRKDGTPSKKLDAGVYDNEKKAKENLNKKLNAIKIDIKFKKSLLGDRGTNTKLVLDDIAKLEKEQDDIISKLKG